MTMPFISQFEASSIYETITIWIKRIPYQKYLSKEFRIYRVNEMKNGAFVLPIFLILLLFSCGKGEDKETTIKGWVPSYTLEGDSSTWITANKDVLVTTPEAAAIIAKAAVISIYGEECAESEQPYKIDCGQNCWTVEGSLQDGHVGGTFFVAIRKKDGKINLYFHEK